MDKIHICLDLLCDYNYIKRESTLKETYESVLNIYKINRTNPDMWKMLWEHKIASLFQMEQQSGINGISILHPSSVDELAILNSTIRLMAQEPGGEMPTEKLARFKQNSNAWLEEMEQYGLGQNEYEILKPVLSMSYGLCIAQEQFMELVQLPALGGFSLTWADKLRKSIAKKNPKEYDLLTKEFYKVTQEKGINQKFVHYVWDVLIAMSRGYGFNQSHTLSYSLVALQEMNLAYYYPIIFWNCACLISDAGGSDEEEIDEEAEEENKVEEIYSNEIEEFNDEVDEEEDSYEEEDVDGYPSEVIVTKTGKKKKKVKSTNYGKVASAIGRIKSEGVSVAAPDINESEYTFIPDINNNAILYGLSGITRIGKDLISEIIRNRPYTGLQDFIRKVKITKPQMVNLIKSGAFDCFGSRFDIMHHYIELISEPKKRMTLQNMKMLIDFGLIPDEYDLQRRTFNFNKYAKKNLKIDEVYYKIDEPAYRFFDTYFSIDKFEPCEDSPTGFKIKQSSWKSIYDAQMDKIRPFVKNHNQELLNAVNQRLIDDLWEKYCLGTISKWEMDSISCYEHDHELAHIAPYYDFVDFNELDEEPVVDQILTFKGKRIPLFKLSRIAGTVLDRDKNKKTVTLLTTTGVVPVKIYGNAFANYDKQLSEKGPDGKKHIIERSWFSRGNKIIVTGIRNGNMFMAKKYKRTPYHLVEKIEQVNEDGSLVIVHGREIE